MGEAQAQRAENQSSDRTSTTPISITGVDEHRLCTLYVYVFMRCKGHSKRLREGGETEPHIVAQLSPEKLSNSDFIIDTRYNHCSRERKKERDRNRRK